MTSADECRRCRFFALRSDRAGELGGGYCRRFPPAFPSWPNVYQQSWCGEFSAAPTGEVE